MNELVQYLIDNLVIDFQGDVSSEKIREFLRADDGQEARKVMAKLVDAKDGDDLVIPLADCLRELIVTQLDPQAIRDQLNVYAES